MTPPPRIQEKLASVEKEIVMVVNERNEAQREMAGQNQQNITQQ